MCNLISIVINKQNFTNITIIYSVKFFKDCSIFPANVKILVQKFPSAVDRPILQLVH